MPTDHPDLHTQRLIMKPLVERHGAALLAYYERNRAYFQPWDPQRPPNFFTEAQQRADIAKGANDVTTGTSARFVAFENARDDIVARFNLSNIRRGVNYSAIVGYSVDRTCAGRGYATELLREIVRYAFESLGLHRLDASFQPENRASGRVLQKNGFIVEGYAREYLFLNGAWRDGVLVSLTNPAFRMPQCY